MRIGRKVVDGNRGFALQRLLSLTLPRCTYPSREAGAKDLPEDSTLKSIMRFIAQVFSISQQIKRSLLLFSDFFHSEQQRYSNNKCIPDRTMLTGTHFQMLCLRYGKGVY